MSKNDIAKIARHYGLGTQIGKAEEELGELMAALLDFQMKMSNVDDQPVALQKSREHLIEEMADSRIMIEQITFLIEAEDEVEMMADYKTGRQIVRITKEENEKR